MAKAVVVSQAVRLSKEEHIETENRPGILPACFFWFRYCLFSVRFDLEYRACAGSLHFGEVSFPSVRRQHAILAA